MPTVQRAPAWRRVRPWPFVMAAAMLMLAALAGPVVAHDGPSRLRDAVVAPRLARTSTPIHFSVVVGDRTGTAVSAVRVEVDGSPRAMVAGGATGQGDESGLRYVGSSRLPAGLHRIAFVARMADGTIVRLPAGLVRVLKPASSGGPAGGGTKEGPDQAANGGLGSSRPAGGSAGTESAGGSSAAGGSTEPQAPAAPGDAASPGAGSGRHPADPEPPGRVTTTPGATANDIAAAAGGPFVPPGLQGDRTDSTRSVPEPAGPQPAGSVDSIHASGPTGVSGSDGQADRGTGGDLGAAVVGGAGRSRTAAAPNARDLLGLGNGLPGELFRSTTILVTTGGSAMVWAAFVIFGRRRRDGDPPAPDPVLAAAAAAPLEAIETAELIPASSGLPVPPGVDPAEAGLPRWRRPSLLQARKTDPLRTATAAVSLTFDDGLVGSPGGVERRRIRYRLVTLMDVPDEVRAHEIGILDRGDEVEIVDVRGTYRLVRCPDGQQGWLHQMVLGEFVGDGDGSRDPVPDGIDEDVLAAFISTRQKTA